MRQIHQLTLYYSTHSIDKLSSLKYQNQDHQYSIYYLQNIEFNLNFVKFNSLFSSLKQKFQHSKIQLNQMAFHKMPIQFISNESILLFILLKNLINHWLREIFLKLFVLFLPPQNYFHLNYYFCYLLIRIEFQKCCNFE
ncbi:hypothetical protein TTHERM_000442799 (macronuclear) [Tetrahymena thermophila SB210]|uniref:Uncharacterized protein n=1 Tax=Tetrahymena thermophila (strain SB210) TaxID=312017 RepID=W7X3V8_TETTS|nr:hypothetical protein TTHERM_000442799 [Tetrahymena thermophila SB210]EWS74005.1 hypothetical protein TTHERM_000442799 [Tetrahymena thermophila SB210]|eukprot:XP_012653467.1 hypothetical protein TTHERM_000442799 [Tetrahymena thermophila SB210]